MCALSGGRSVESTMGFTALDGLPMGTRPGQLDPGVVLYLIEEEGMAPAEVTQLLYNDSGLKGLSGVSNDMRDLLASDDPGAAFAIDHFVHRCALHAGRSPPPSAASTPSSSPPASASTPPDPCPHRRAPGLARRGPRRSGERSRRHPHLHAGEPRRAPRRPDRRGADDRPPHPRPDTERRMTLPPVKAKLLDGKKGLIVGIANDRSIAWGCARAFRALGAELAITYLNEKAKPHVEPLAREVEAPIFLPMDVMADGQLEAVFDRIARDWGRLDFLVHSIAFSTKDALGGRVVDVPRQGFQVTMDVSVWSFCAWPTSPSH